MYVQRKMSGPEDGFPKEVKLQPKNRRMVSSELEKIREKKYSRWSELQAHIPDSGRVHDALK